MPHLSLPDHPMRYETANELHARPFPELSAPCRCAYIAIKQPKNAAKRDRSADRAHLIALLDRYGASHPPPDAGHYSGPLGRGFLKWEMHTEFVTYALFTDGVAEVPFSAESFSVFPADWLAEAPGAVLTSSLIRMETANPEELAQIVDSKLHHWFVPESLAAAQVVDQEAVVASDFRLDERGHIRIAILAREGIGKRRLGRIAQRLLEIETYKAASMLTLPVARKVASRVAELDEELTDVVSAMSDPDRDPAETLDALMKIAGEIEAMSSDTAFRFGAAGAYAAIVNQRIQVLREERIAGRQLFSEFMMRRYDPAMRTCRSAEERLKEISARAERAANLLGTRVNVALTHQNAKSLESMDRRADLQLRLQETVEGLSVVAISYYAVSLLGYLLGPLGYEFGISKSWILAGVTIPTVLLVWAMVRQIKKRVAAKAEH